MNGYEYCTIPCARAYTPYEDNAKLVRQNQQRRNAAQTRQRLSRTEIKRACEPVVAATQSCN